MGDRVSLLQRRLGFDPGRIMDTYVSAAPLLRKAPGLCRLGHGAPAAADETAEEMAEAKLSDLIEDMDRARVTASLMTLHEETDEFLRLARRHPGRLFGLAGYDSLSPRPGLERVQALWKDHPGLILGVTTALAGSGQDPRLKAFVPLYEFCAESGLPIQFHGESDADEAAPRPMALAVLARSYPGLKIIGRFHRDWHAEALALLNRFPNLFLQVDGLTLPRLPPTADNRKLLFGSGWRGREAGYFEGVEALRRLPWRPRRNVGWRTAVRVYGSRILGPSARANSQPSPR